MSHKLILMQSLVAQTAQPHPGKHSLVLDARGLCFLYPYADEADLQPHVLHKACHIGSSRQTVQLKQNKLYTLQLHEPLAMPSVCPCVQELLWTLISLADDDSLCRRAIAASGALPCIVPLLTASPFDPATNGFMGVPALAARALRVLAEDAGTSSPLQDAAPAEADTSSTEGAPSWRQEAVPCLLQMLAKAQSSAQEASELESQRVLRTTSSTLNERLRELRLLCLAAALFLPAALMCAFTPLRHQVTLHGVPCSTCCLHSWPR